MAPSPQHPPSHEPTGATLMIRPGHLPPTAPRAPGAHRAPNTDPPGFASTGSGLIPIPGAADARHGGPRRPQPPGPARSPVPVPGPRGERGPGRVQRSRRKATCVPGRSLPPIAPRRGGCAGPAAPGTPRTPRTRRTANTPRPPARPGAPRKRPGHPPGAGLSPGQAAEHMADGKAEAGSGFFIEQRGQPGGLSWGWAPGTPRSLCSGEEEKESGVSARTPDLLPPPQIPPGPPTHHGHLIQVLERGGPAPGQPHQQRGRRRHQQAHGQGDDSDHARAQLGGVLLCGERWAPVIRLGTPLFPSASHSSPWHPIIPPWCSVIAPGILLFPLAPRYFSSWHPIIPPWHPVIPLASHYSPWHSIIPPGTLFFPLAPRYFSPLRLVPSLQAPRTKRWLNSGPSHPPATSHPSQSWHSAPVSPPEPPGIGGQKGSPQQPPKEGGAAREARGSLWDLHP